MAFNVQTAKSFQWKCLGTPDFKCIENIFVYSIRINVWAKYPCGLFCINLNDIWLCECDPDAHMHAANVVAKSIRGWEYSERHYTEKYCTHGLSWVLMGLPSAICASSILVMSLPCLLMLYRPILRLAVVWVFSDRSSVVVTHVHISCIDKLS